MYVPKSRIVTNLYTNTKELVLKDTQEYYTGFYYKTFNGKYYTGKTPNDPPNDELVKVEDTAVTFEPNQPQNEIAYGDFPTIFDSLGIALIFTVVSMIRSALWRYYFRKNEK